MCMILCNYTSSCVYMHHVSTCIHLSMYILHLMPWEIALLTYLAYDVIILFACKILVKQGAIVLDWKMLTV